MGNILLELIEDCESKAPQCWEMAEKIRELEMDWDASCYLPVKKALELAGYLISDYKEAVIFASFMMVLAPWRLSKEVFAYTPELMELLCDQADMDIDVPTDILKYLPFQCVYIEASLVQGMNGFFVTINENETKELEIRFLIVFENKSIDCLTLAINEKNTIRQAYGDIQLEEREMIQTMFGIPYPSESVEELKSLGIEGLMARMVQLVLYICADNCDRSENEQQKKITKRGAVIHNAYREIRKWDIGTRITKIVRRQRQEELKETEDAAEGQKRGKSKRPHVRRGHWHYYWAGKREERRRILKWTAPSYINLEKLEDLPVVKRIMDE